MRSSFLSLSLLSLCALGACQTAKSSNPLSPSVAGPISGVTISSPQPVTPTANAQIPIPQQPITLTVKNASTTGVRPLTYDFQVASDQAFSKQVFAKASITPGDNQTSVQLGDSLGNAGIYYWRARAEDGANTGNWTNATAFTMYVPVVIQAPTPVQPVNGSTVSSPTPTFVVTDAARTGPAGTIHYNLEIAQDTAFAQLLLATSFPEQPNQTSMGPVQALPVAATLFWRVQASDGTNDGPWSAIQNLHTPAAPTPTAPPPTSPTTGGGGGGGAADQINMAAASIYNSPFDMANWNVSTSITGVQFRGDGISVAFSKKDGAGRWPDVTPPGWDGPLEYTLGMCLNIGGHWDCSAVIEAWNGLDPVGGPPSQIGLNWFYDDLRWGPMAHHQPSAGEQIGIFVCEGDCRNNTQGTSSPLRERSNVVLVTFPGGF